MIKIARIAVLLICAYFVTDFITNLFPNTVIDETLFESARIMDVVVTKEVDVTPFCGAGSSLPMIAIPVGKRFQHMTPLLTRLTQELNVPASCIVIVTNIEKKKTEETLKKYQSEFGVSYWINEKSDPTQGLHEIITRHFFAMFDLIFDEKKAPAIIVLEDDLYVSDDFWEFFVKGARVMKRDQTIFCWSAWNDVSEPLNLLHLLFVERLRCYKFR